MVSVIKIVHNGIQRQVGLAKVTHNYLDLWDLWSQHFAGNVKWVLLHVLFNQVDVSSLQLQIGTKLTVSLHKPLLY